METKTPPLVILLLLDLIFLICSQEVNAKKLLSHIYAQKLDSSSGIDKSHFNGSNDRFQGAKLQLVHPHQKESDLIERLPGQPPVHFKQYGGYVTVDREAGRAFYYYFVDAATAKKNNLPLLLWLNGGPGCSSLAYGAMQELGPFRVHSDGKTLYKNKFAWNHAANVLFLESPAGVGFSYSNTTTDIVKGGDRQTALDNLVFLLNWFERFPEYKDRELYLSGESYAGHYVPQLAHVILHHNRQTGKSVINLKGILIGNAVINDETDFKGMYEFFGSHALVSDETTSDIMKYCNFSTDATQQLRQCTEALSEAEYNLKHIDVYNIYAPLCSNSKFTNKSKIPGYTTDPCSDNYVMAYFNRPDVQKALHANVTAIPYRWQPCSNVIEKWLDSPVTVIPLLKELMANGLRVWIFSGDTDGRIPVTSTKQSIKTINLPIQVPWHPWYLSGEVGGYTQVYHGNLTFATVRGAGHQVPSFQPARALSLIFHFLAGTQLPNSSTN